MNHNFNVSVFPSDGSGCGTYRMIWPGQALKAQGKSVSILQKPVELIIDEYSGQVMDVNPGTADILVIQRPGSYQVQQMIPLLHENGKKLVIDMDDSLSLINPKNPAHKEYDPRLNHHKNWMHVATACRMADLVTVTTEKLAEEYGQHGRVVIIPNHIPQRYLSIPRPENEIPIVGWAGWTVNHGDDLWSTNGMINQAIVETGAKFAAFGDDAIFHHLGIRNRYPNECWGFENIMDYPNRLVGFDIGLVPLEKTEFNEGKSWLKGMEYASLGIVPVVTPIGNYLDLIDLGAAIPANTPKEWYSRVKELVLDHEMRQELSEKVRQIASNYTIESNCGLWWSAWEKAYNGVVQ